MIGIYGVVQPFATALLAYLIEGETVALRHILGGALILSGLVATSLAQEPAASPRGSRASPAPSLSADADAVVAERPYIMYAPALATPLLDAPCEGGCRAAVPTVIHAPSPTFKGVYRPFLQRPGYEEAPSERMAGEITDAAVPTVIHAPRAIRLVHPQLHASPPSSFLRQDSDEYVRM